MEGIQESQERAQLSILNVLDARTRDEYGNPCDEHYWSCMWHYRKHCPQDRQEICAEKNTPSEPRKRLKYSIDIHMMDSENWTERGYPISVHTSKEYGNCLGGAGGVKTKEDAVQRIREAIEQWETYDSIVGRMSDKVTIKNTEFTCCFDDITLQDILKGQKRVQDFFNP